MSGQIIPLNLGRVKRRMHPALQFVLVFAIGLYAAWHIYLSVAYMRQTINDQRQYIENGCNGRYQGSGS